MRKIIIINMILVLLCGCEKDPIPNAAPTVITGEVTNIGNTFAKVTLKLDNSRNCKEIGVLYSATDNNPTCSNAQKENDDNPGYVYGDKDFTIVGLKYGSMYYYRAYITNGTDYIYGDVKTFTTTDINYPTVLTSNVSSISSTTASCGGAISSAGGGSVTARGVCWSTSTNPTVNLPTKTLDGTGTSSFTSLIDGLAANTSYYVRAYATNEKGTAYGASVSFKTTNSQTKNGYTLTQNEIWSGNILLKGDIVVPVGITLTINPGTIINISADAPLYDGGDETGEIAFTIKGSLIINGTAQNIIQLKSAANSPTNSDWGGIYMLGNRLEIAYCYISDSRYGVFCFSSSTVAMKIKNCLFNNMSNTAIVDFGSLQHTLSSNSFINVFWGYDLYVSNKNARVDYSEFKNNSYDLFIYYSNSTISVNYSNFSGNKFYNIYWGSSATNSKITANYCYGIATQTTTSGIGNTYTYTNKLTTPYSSAGCGFSSMAKSPSFRSSAIGNPEQIKRTIHERNEIIQQHEKLKQQLKK